MDPHSHEVDLTDVRNGVDVDITKRQLRREYGMKNVGVENQEPDMIERFTMMPPVPAAEIEHLIKPICPDCRPPHCRLTQFSRLVPKLPIHNKFKSHPLVRGEAQPDHRNS